MNSGLSDTNPVLVAAFKAALLHQGLIVVALLLAMALAWVSVREWWPAGRAAGGLAGSIRSPRTGLPQPAARRLLRIGFGILWIFDGLLQGQSAMPAGLPARVIEPTAASSPLWVQHLVNWAGTTWSYHPIEASASAVWIQLGIGAWLLAAASGRPSRLAGLVSAGWALVVWVFGESFGGIFAPGLTALTGAPGAAALYLVAGLLLALPDRCWRTARTGRRVLDGMGLFFLGMALLQAWPGRGFWSGPQHGGPHPLASMIATMSGTPQPRFLAAWVSDFASLAAAHGFAVNLAAVIALAVIGAGLLSRSPRLIRPTLALMIAVCLADWVLVQDLGFLGGLGTDPNSMIPLVLVACGGYLALVRVPAVTPDLATAPQPGTEAAPPGRLPQAVAATGLRAVIAAWAAAVVVIGAAPAAMAQANPHADAIIAQAIAGSYAPLNLAAPAFTLTDQNGAQVSLASLRGKVVLLTFLDPVCTTDCPLIAQEFRQADQILGRSSRSVELVAIVANPVYRSQVYTRAFDRQENLAQLANWRYLTGPLAQLSRAWGDYNAGVSVASAGGMVAHGDLAYVIDARGHIRAELNFNPGPGTASSVSSFAVELSSAARLALRSS